jgi:methylated-DNA-protein-cysteine methyltransferase-like protein
MAVQRNRAGFFARVYAVVRRVPRGSVTSYGAIARVLGSPHGARTVGWALHSLPEDSDVPWQRVVNSQGRISGDSRQDGPSRQRELLEEEGVSFDERDRIDLDRYGWDCRTGLETEELIGLT